MARSGFTFSIQGDIDAAKRLSDDARAVKRAQVRALLTLRRRILVVARRDIQQEYTLRASRVNQDLRARVVTDGLQLTGYSRGITLGNFGGRRTRTGLSAAIKRGVRKKYPHAFIAPSLDSNAPIAFRRTGFVRRMEAGRYVGRMRETIESLYGPSVAQMLKHGQRPERIEAAAETIIATELDRQLGAA